MAEQPHTQILGPGFALLILSGLVVLGARGRASLAGALARLSNRVQARAPRVLALLRRRHVPVAVAALGATVWLSSAFHDIAYSHDHAEHCWKAFHFWHQLLGRGRLQGWTHFLAFGYPSGELTPFGPELWVALFRLATLGLLSWTRTYALAFSGVVVFAIGGVYYFTRRFFGPAAGVIAAAVWAFDPGGWYQGGWFWLEWLGVWPVTLAMTFTLLAHLKLIDVLGVAPERRSDRTSRTPRPSRPRRDALWAAFFMLASLVVHQLPIVVYAVTLPCLLLATWLREPRFPTARWIACGATVALGVGLAAFYLLPMFARNELSQDLGVRGFALDELGRRLVEMRVFDAGWAPIAVLGFLGCVRAIRARTTVGLFFVLTSAVFVLLSSDILVSIFHAERLMPGILKIECPRMLLIAKLFWFPLAAEAALGALRAITPVASDAAGGPPAAPAQQLVAVLMVAALGAPVARSAALHLYNTQVDHSVEHRADTPLARDLRAFFQWSLAERRAHQDEPYRIAYTLTDQHDHIVSIAPVFNQTPLYKVGYTSAQQFRDFPMSGRPELFAALSVKYLLSDHDLPGTDFVRVRDFGQLRLYRLAGYRERHPFTLLGAGRVELLEMAPERIRLRLQGISAGARLKLHVARFPRWQATLDGRALAIAPATVQGMEYPLLMEVPAADGELVFRYVRRAPDWAGVAVTVIALALFGLLASGRIGWLQRHPCILAACSLIARNATRGAALAGVAVLIAAGAAVARLAAPPRLPRDHLLAIASARGGQLTLAGLPCVAGGVTHWQCGPHRLEQEIRSGSYGAHLCLTAPQVGPLVVSVRTRLGRYLQTSFDPSGSPPGRVRVWLDGASLGDEVTQGPEQGLQFLQADTRARAGATGDLRVELEGPPLHCFDLRLIR